MRNSFRNLVQKKTHTKKLNWDDLDLSLQDDQDVEGIAEREPDEDTDGDGVWEGEDAEGKEPDEDTDGDGVWEGEDTEGNETEPAAAAGGGYDVDYKVNRPPEEQTKVFYTGCLGNIVLSLSSQSFSTPPSPALGCYWSLEYFRYLGCNRSI